MANERASLLVVAGGHDETSLGWATAAAWLDRSPDNRVLMTVRSDRALAFVEGKPRVDVIQLDWVDDDAADRLAARLRGERVAGAIHSIAGADLASFSVPAHELAPQVYVDAFDTTAVTLVRLVAGCRAALVPNAGVVTFGYGEFGAVSEVYGGAMSVAKIALAQTVAVLGVSLGRATPPVRTLEIVTGLIPTYGARGVAAGISRRAGRRVKVDDMTQAFLDGAPLAGTNGDGQRTAAAALAISFVADEAFAHTTGERIHVDGGWTTTAKSVAQ